MRFYKQPLLHFLLLGALVFIGSVWFNQAGSDGLVITRNSFLEFLQYRNKGIGSNSAEEMLVALSKERRKTLLAKHVEEEVLYFEALQLGLDKKDYVIKQRLIQKMNYLLEGASSNATALDPAEVEAYFERNTARYFAPATATFTHVFINNSHIDAKTHAESVKQQLNKQQVPFEHATRFGDRFVYYSNYVERDQEFVRSHFGHDFAQHIFVKMLAAEQWGGPVKSNYGWHLVKLAVRKEGATPPLASIFNRVLQDAQFEKKAQLRHIQVQALIDSYQLVLPDLSTIGPAKL